MSDLHQTFSVCQVWYPEEIIKVCGHAYTRAHAQHMKMGIQLSDIVFCHFEAFPD